jgi:hypothetical protein
LTTFFEDVYVRVKAPPSLALPLSKTASWCYKKSVESYLELLDVNLIGKYRFCDARKSSNYQHGVTAFN